MQLKKPINSSISNTLKYIYMHVGIISYYIIKLGGVFVVHLFGYRTNGVKNYLYLAGLDIKCLAKDFFEVPNRILGNGKNKFVVVGPLTSFDAAQEAVKHLDENDFVVFLKPRNWNFEKKIRRIFFLNKASKEFFSHKMDEYACPTDIMYVGDPLGISLDLVHCEVKKTIQIPVGFQSIGFSLNRAICTLVTDFSVAEIFVTGVNFHLGDKLYLDDYKTSLKNNNGVDAVKLKQSLFKHDWLFNFLLTKRFKKFFQVRFDENSQKILEMSTIRAAMCFAKRYNR